MNALEEFRTRLGQCPLVAILRGVPPAEAAEIGENLVAAGIRIVEVPLNSPDPYASIRNLVARLEGRALIGAGTVLDPAEVARVREAGGQLVVSPNTHGPVIEASVAAGLVSMPGYFTPSEALAALRAGAHALKLFPAEAASPAVLKAQSAILPSEVPLLAVGGITPENMQLWLEAGAAGFGLGSGLYRPGQPPDQVGKQARLYVRALGR